MTSQVIPESELHTEYQRNQRKMISSEPADLLGMVSYQDGAVISKTLIKCDCDTVTLFAFDQGQGLSEHESSFDALVQILEDTVEITVSGRLARATKGQILTLPANHPHALTALSKFKMLLTMIRS